MSDMVNEIVGAKIGTLITNNPKTIADAVERGAITEWLDRRKMQLMSSMGLGRKWDIMAGGPTLFYFDENGKPRAAR